MELEPNMYVRTEYGGIKKITNFKPITKYTKYNTLNLDNTLGEFLFTDEELKEIKASHSIIDLVQAGDYVNGLKVYEVRNDIKGFGVVVFSDCSIHEWQINSIVTKEQFEQMQYKVGE